jgi:8-oxo-dGTP pyrophosphatase MutT (NUDIX family)
LANNQRHSCLPQHTVISACAASAVIVNQDQTHVLLMLRDDMPLWTNIGGHCETGEDFLTTLHREALEEICTEIDIIRLVGDFYSPMPTEFHYRHEQVYLATINPNAPLPKIGTEGVKLEWFDLNNLPANLGPRFRMRILAFLKHQEPVSQTTDALLGMLDFAKTLAVTDFYGLHEWLHHPNVLSLKANGTLRYDVTL